MLIVLCRAAAIVAGVILAGSAVVTSQQRAGDTFRTIYVTATDQRGARVADLKTTDFTVREAGRDRPVEQVGPADQPLRLAVAVDELLAPNTIVRQAVFRLIQRLDESGDVALFVMGQRNEQRVAYGGELSTFVSALNAFPPRAQYPGLLVQAVFEIARDLRALEGRRVIIVLAPEMPQQRSLTAEGVFDQLRDNRVTLYAATFVGWRTRPGTLVELPPTRLEGGDLTEEVDRDRVLGDGPRRSGGLRVPSTTPDGFGPALTEIADDLLGQYQVTYALPAGTKSDGRISLSAKRQGLRLRGPSRLPEIR
jgi:hypothetical protein